MRRIVCAIASCLFLVACSASSGSGGSGPSGDGGASDGTSSGDGPSEDSGRDAAPDADASSADGPLGMDGAPSSDGGLDAMLGSDATSGDAASGDASVGDPSFGDGGAVTNWPPVPDGGPALAGIWSIAVRPDGRIVVGMAAGYRAYEVGQLLADGSAFDSTFGTGGLVLLPGTNTTFDGDYYGGARVALAPDGSIVVSYGCPAATVTDPLSNTCVTRLTATGSVDTTFGSSGTVEYDSQNLGAQLAIESIVVDPSDQTWFSGGWYNINGNLTGAAYIGGLDATGNPAFVGYENQGISAIGGSDCPGVGVQSTGRLLLLCATGAGMAPILEGISQTTGLYDTTFGQQGTVNLPVGTLGGMSVRSDDSIVVVEDVAVGSATGFGAIRLSPAGTPIPSFGDAGTLTASTPGALILCGAASVGPVDYAAGTVASGGSTALVALKLLDGGLDPAYGAGGIGIIGIQGSARAMNAEPAGVLIGGEDGMGSTMLVRALP